MLKRLLTMMSVLAFIALLTIPAAAKEIILRGHLAQTVEAGGWLLTVEKDGQSKKYLLLNAKQFQNETWFRVGAEVVVTGVLKRDSVTIYQEGIPFQVRTMRPIDKNKAMAYRKEARNAEGETESRIQNSEYKVETAFT